MKRPRASVLGLLTGVLLTPIAFLVEFRTGIETLLFPLPVFSAGILGVPPLAFQVLAGIQFPVYGWLIGRARERKDRRAAVWLLIHHASLFGLCWWLPPVWFA